jgi:uncharacterized alkaline shock family protein YloU
MNYFNNVFKIISLCCVVLYTAIFIVGGAFLVIYTEGRFGTTGVHDFMASFWGKLVGIVAILVGVAFIVSKYLATKRENCIAFDSAEGEVIIAVSAIEDFVRRLAKSFWEVKDAMPTIEPRDDGVAVDMKVVLWDDKNIQATTGKIQKTVKSQIQDFFGLANVHHVKVFVMKTVSREAPPEKEVQEREADEREEDENA